MQERRATEFGSVRGNSMADFRKFAEFEIGRAFVEFGKLRGEETKLGRREVRLGNWEMVTQWMECAGRRARWVLREFGSCRRGTGSCGNGRGGKTTGLGELNREIRGNGNRQTV